MMSTSTTMGLSVPSTTGTNRYPGIAHQVKVYDPGVPDVDLLVHAQVLDAEQRPSTIAVMPLTRDEALNLIRAIQRALGVDPDVEDYGGHTFQVMCAGCLNEPMDAEGECPEAQS